MGATNAGLLAAQILALNDPQLSERVDAYRTAQTASVPDAPKEAEGAK
jgi:5-(carboxyamino)imidazole ribonucleotide mutase